MADADEARAREWLGGEHDGQTLPDAIQKMLLVGFREDVWTMEDVPSLDEEMSTARRDKNKALWKCALSDSAALAKMEKLATHWIRFEMWYDAAYPLQQMTRTRATRMTRP